MVSSPAGNGSRHSAGDPSEEGSIASQRRNDPSALSGRVVLVERMEALRHGYRSQGIPQEVRELLLAGNRPSTSATYQSAWNGWSSWCLERHLDPLESNMISILSFLEYLFSSGRAHSTVNVSRSMLSKTLPPVDGMEIGKHPLIVRLMRAIYNKNPPRARYSHMWDVSQLLNYIKSINSDGLSLGDISSIVATLLAVNTMTSVRTSVSS